MGLITSKNEWFTWVPMVDTYSFATQIKRFHVEKGFPKMGSDPDTGGPYDPYKWTYITWSYKLTTGRAYLVTYHGMFAFYARKKIDANQPPVRRFSRIQHQTAVCRVDFWGPKIGDFFGAKMGCCCPKRRRSTTDAAVHPVDPDPMWLLRVSSFMEMTGAVSLLSSEKSP